MIVNKKTDVALTGNGALVRANKRYETRKRRIGYKMRSTGKLRLSIFRSNEHIYGQIIDDAKGMTLVQANSMEKDVDHSLTGKEIAATIGAKLAERAQAKKLSDIVFDRNGFRYTGRVAALGDAFYNTLDK